MDSLVGVSPQRILFHGPTKLLVDNYHWHSPEVGIVASYTPKERDVHDHFGIFRGVDQIESFAQATIVSCGTFLGCVKQGCTPEDLRQKFTPIFISVGHVVFQNYLEKGDTFVCIGRITFSKFRQMTCDGRIYKVPKDIDPDAYFADFSEERLMGYELSSDFVLVSELFDITGRAIKNEYFIK